MKKYYVTEMHNTGEEFEIIALENKQEAIKRARSEWKALTESDRRKVTIEIRDYVEDIEDEDCNCYDYNTIAWQIWTANRETGDLIEQCETVLQAERLIDEYEENDKIDETFVPDFYDIVNENHEHIEENGLKSFREAAGLTQAELSERSDVSVRMIQHYEQGVKDVNKAAADTVRKLAEALHVEIKDLLHD